MSEQKVPNIWAPVKESHAILQAAAIVEFSEPATSLIWQKIAPAAEALAAKYALPEKADIKSFNLEIKPGAAPQPRETSEDGMAFSRRASDGTAEETMTVERNSLRIDTWQYTRWVQMRSWLADVLNELLPLYQSAVVPFRLSLEYQDLFHAKDPGPADAGLLLNQSSRYFDGTSLDMWDAWHSNRGWFEDHTDQTRLLVNADLVAADAKSPIGVRRIVRIRTFESLRLAHGRPQSEALVSSSDEALAAFDKMHTSLKKRLGDILTPEAQEMIALGA